MSTRAHFLGVPLTWFDFAGKSSDEIVKDLAIALAAIVAFAVMPIAWNESSGRPSIFWTGLGTASMAFAALVGGFHRYAERRLAVLVTLYLLLYLVGSQLSVWLVPGDEVARQRLLLDARLALVLTAVYFGFGVVVGGRQAVAGFVVVFAALLAYAAMHADQFTLEGIAARTEQGLTTQYQQLGDGFAICALMLMACTRSARASIVLAAIAIPVLFFIPSRSAAFLGAGCLLFAVFSRCGRRGQIGLAIAVIVGLVVFHEAIYVQAPLEGTRHETIAKGDVDESVVGREEILERGLEVIAEHPFLGEFGFQLREFNAAGYYIHNALDAWAQAGLAAFVAFVFLWFFVAAQWLGQLSRDRQAAVNVAPMLIFGLLSWVFARNASYAILMFTVGYFTGQLLSATQVPVLRTDRRYPAMQRR